MIGMKYRSLFTGGNVTRAVRRNEKTMLFKVGAYVRKTARRSILAGKKGQKSLPGRPPFTWTKRYRASILFAHDPARRSVVVGGIAFGIGAVPQAIEYGGMRLSTDKKTGLRKISHYRARPAVRLALRDAVDKAVAAILKDYVVP